MPASNGDLRRMACDLSAAADAIRSAHSILIVTHIDADGISAGAIAYMTV